MTPENRKAPQFRNTRKTPVMLYGEVLADVFPDRTVLGGAPFNVAAHLQAFGLCPVLISRVGHDVLRDRVLGKMSERGMETVGIQIDKNRPTGQVKVHEDEGGHRFEILPLQAYDFIHPGVVRMITLSVHPALVYFGTLAQRNEMSRRGLSAMLRSTDAPKFLDINLRQPWVDEVIVRSSLENANILKLNEEELTRVAAMVGLTERPAREQARELLQRYDLERIVVTCGARGAWMCCRDGKDVEDVPLPLSGEIVDTVGAGDGFAAVYILGMLRSWPMADTLRRANAFAASLCRVRGAVPEQADFYAPFIEEWRL